MRILKRPACCICGRPLGYTRVVCRTAQGIRFGFHLGACADALVRQHQGIEPGATVAREVLREWAEHGDGRVHVPTTRAARWLYPELYPQ